MQKSLGIRLVISALAIGCAVYSVFFARYASLPFRTQPHGAHTLVVESLSRVSLPPELHAGDIIDLRQQTPTMRAALWVGWQLPKVATYQLTVNRDGRTFSVPVTTTAVFHFHAGDVAVIGFYVGLSLVLALITLWWGRDWAAWGVMIYGLASILGRFTIQPLPPLAGVIMQGLHQIFGPLSVVGLYVMVFALIGRVLGPGLRWLLHAALGLSLGAWILPTLVSIVDFVVYAGTRFSFGLATTAGFLMAIIVPVVALAIGFSRTDKTARFRLRWVLASLALLVAAEEWNNISRAFGLLPHLPEHSGTIIGIILALAGLIYGLLARRIVRLSFVVNRGLVYGVTGAFIVGIFALVESIIDLASLGSSISIALNVIVSLAIGLGLEALRQRIDDLIERVLFRRKHRAEAALEQFVRHCPYIEHRQRLLDEAVRVVDEHVRARGVALYERRGDAYNRVVHKGERTFPERVETDDRAFIALRAEATELDLADIGSALGESGYAFPMTLRGVLLGALVCGARTEPWSPDERGWLSRLAHEVGIALHALRARENETLVDALANGALEPGTARTRARALNVARS
jgi:GAF domain-containing protein